MTNMERCLVLTPFSMSVRIRSSTFFLILLPPLQIRQAHSQWRRRRCGGRAWGLREEVLSWLGFLNSEPNQSEYFKPKKKFPTLNDIEIYLTFSLKSGNKYNWFYLPTCWLWWGRLEVLLARWGYNLYQFYNLLDPYQGFVIYDKRFCFF